jgi:hypothetical protein
MHEHHKLEEKKRSLPVSYAVVAYKKLIEAQNSLSLMVGVRYNHEQTTMFL